MSSKRDLKPKKDGNKEYLLNIGFSSNNRERLLNELNQHLSSQAVPKIFTIFTPNPEQVVLAQNNDTFRSVLNRSTISFPDGIGIVMAHALLKNRPNSALNPRLKLKRIAGVDFMMDLIKLGYQAKKRLFLLGGLEDTAKMATQKIKSQFPGLIIESHPGSLTIAHETAMDRQAALDHIAKFKPDILFVAFGAPHQEKWIDSNRGSLEKAGVRVAMAVGGSLDIVAGRLTRAPKFIRMIGLEWLYRLGQEPWRWKRQLQLLTFAKLVVKQLY